MLVHLLDERLPVALLRQIWMNYSLEQSLPPRHQTLGALHYMLPACLPAFVGLLPCACACCEVMCKQCLLGYDSGAIVPLFAIVPRMFY